MTSDSEFEPDSDEIRLATVFVTGTVIELDMAVDAFKRARVPFLTQGETSTGMKLSMPVAPTHGPGTFWSILVPEKALQDARQVLSDLPFPITTNPGPWDFLPSRLSEEALADARGQRWTISIGFLLLSAFFIALGCAILASGREREDGIGVIVIGMVMMAIVGALIVHSRRWLKRHPEPRKNP
jgi:hypothetical protein